MTPVRPPMAATLGSAPGHGWRWPDRDAGVADDPRNDPWAAPEWTLPARHVALLAVAAVAGMGLVFGLL